MSSKSPIFCLAEPCNYMRILLFHPGVHRINLQSELSALSVWNLWELTVVCPVIRPTKSLHFRLLGCSHLVDNYWRVSIRYMPWLVRETMDSSTPTRYFLVPTVRSVSRSVRLIWLLLVQVVRLALLLPTLPNHLLFRCLLFVGVQGFRATSQSFPQKGYLA